MYRLVAGFDSGEISEPLIPVLFSVIYSEKFEIFRSKSECPEKRPKALPSACPTCLLPGLAAPSRCTPWGHKENVTFKQISRLSWPKLTETSDLNGASAFRLITESENTHQDFLEAPGGVITRKKIWPKIISGDFGPFAGCLCSQSQSQSQVVSGSRVF